MSYLPECLLARCILLLAIIAGPFSILPAYSDEDPRKAAPPPGKALVFVFRSERVPVAVQAPVVVNAERVGVLANGTFITTVVNPGKTFIRVGDRVISTLSFVASANQRYFARVSVIGGEKSARAELNLVNEAEGRRLIAQSRFAGGRAPAVTAVAPRPQQRPAAPVEKPSEPPKPVTAQPKIMPEAQVASAPAVSTAPKSDRNWDFALIANAGTFKLSDSNQTVAGLAFPTDAKSKSVFGVEAELRHNAAGFALGGEVFSYKNDILATATAADGVQAVRVYMVNGKYYFRVTDGFYPFLGAGLGQARATYSGGWTGSTKGPAYQGMAGMEFRFKQVGLYVQYKYLVSSTGSGDQTVKVGGSGIFAGLSVSF